MNSCNGCPQRWAWSVLTAKEPKLLDLENDIRETAQHLKSHGPSIDQVWASRSGYKKQLMKLVGWSATHPDLQTSTAYEIAYAYLYGLLEDRYDQLNGARY